MVVGMASNFSALLMGLAFVVAATASYACSRVLPQGADRAVTQRIDQRLLDAAVRAEVNWHRCRAGLAPLGAAKTALVEVAAAHSHWMARSGTLSHRSNVAGKASLTDRIRAANVQVRRGAENLGMVHRFRIDGKHFRILDSNACSFASHQGELLSAHSYASLAQHAVGLWMASSGHRKNILDPQVTRVSTAAAYGASRYCGQIWLTQNFVG